MKKLFYIITPLLSLLIGLIIGSNITLSQSDNDISIEKNKQIGQVLNSISTGLMSEDKQEFIYGFYQLKTLNSLNILLKEEQTSNDIYNLLEISLYNLELEMAGTEKEILSYLQIEEILVISDTLEKISLLIYDSDFDANTNRLISEFRQQISELEKKTTKN